MSSSLVRYIAPQERAHIKKPSSNEKGFLFILNKKKLVTIHISFVWTKNF